MIQLEKQCFSPLPLEKSSFHLIINKVLMRMFFLLRKVWSYIMITQEDKQAIRKLSKQYDVKRVLLFGSSTTGIGADIDLAVEGVKPESYFSYYADLMFSLSKPVDLIDLSGNSKFIQMVKNEGVLLYG